MLRREPLRFGEAGLQSFEVKFASEREMICMPNAWAVRNIGE